MVTGKNSTKRTVSKIHLMIIFDLRFPRLIPNKGTPLYINAYQRDPSIWKETMPVHIKHPSLSF